MLNLFQCITFIMRVPINNSSSDNQTHFTNTFNIIIAAVFIMTIIPIQSKERGMVVKFTTDFFPVCNKHKCILVIELIGIL